MSKWNSISDSVRGERQRNTRGLLWKKYLAPMAKHHRIKFTRYQAGACRIRLLQTAAAWLQWVELNMPRPGSVFKLFDSFALCSLGLITLKRGVNCTHDKVNKARITARHHLYLYHLYQNRFQNNVGMCKQNHGTLKAQNEKLWCFRP